MSAAPRSRAVEVMIRAERCVTVQRPGVPCRACAETCPTDAVELGERSLAIILDRCLRCGRCAAACPTEALAVDGFSEIPTSTVRLECARVPAGYHAAQTASLPCLGGLTAAALRARLVARDGTVLQVVDRGWCGSCPAGGTEQPWRGPLARVADELSRLPTSWRVDVVRVPLPREVAGPPPAPWPRREEALGRRDLFRGASAGRRGLRPRRLAARGEGRPRGVDNSALRARAARLSALAAAERAPSSVFPDLAVAESCCDRRLCAASCPTGALHLELDEEGSVLAFDPVVCTGCRACVEVCPTGSLVLLAAGGPAPVERRALRRRTLARCEYCGWNYGPASESGRCPACETDRELSVFVHGWVRGRRRAAED